MKHERQILIPGWNQEALRRTGAMVIGAGALGSALALYLTRLGIGSLILVDPDVLEEHNLENQAYDSSDLGKPKVRALAEKIQRIDPSIRITAVQARIQDYAGEWPPWVFGCLDNVAARHYLNHLAHEKGFTYIDAGIEGFRGSVKTIRPGTSCYSCWPILPQPQVRASCSSLPIPSTYVTASITAGLQAMQFLKMLQGREWKDYLSVDLERSQIREDTLHRNPDCIYCSAHREE